MAVKVLVVEDDPVLRTLTRDMIKMTGLEAVAAKDMDEAVSIYSQYSEEIGLVILDMHLEDVTGIEVLEELKKINSGIKAILASGILMDSDKEEIFKHGFIDFIQKPYRMKVMQELVKKHTSGE